MGRRVGRGKGNWKMNSVAFSVISLFRSLCSPLCCLVGDGMVGEMVDTLVYGSCQVHEEGFFCLWLLPKRTLAFYLLFFSFLMLLLFSRLNSLVLDPKISYFFALGITGDGFLHGVGGILIIFYLYGLVNSHHKR